MNARKSSLLRPALAAVALAAVGVLPATVLAQQVVRDAETGQLRAPNAAEAAALAPRQAARQQRSAATASTAEVGTGETVYADGTVEMATDESHVMYSVVRRNADGSMDRFCVQGKDQANKLSKTKTFAKPVMMSKTATHGGGYELK